MRLEFYDEQGLSHVNQKKKEDLYNKSLLYNKLCCLNAL